MESESLNDIISQKILFGDLEYEDAMQSFTSLVGFLGLVTVQEGVKASGLHYRTVERLSRVQVGKIKFVELQELSSYKSNRNKSG